MADVRYEMQKTLEDCAGIYRTGRALSAGLDALRGLQERATDLAIEDGSRTFNTERLAALELTCMLDVAVTIVAAALAREESRGAHQRTDFAARDDNRFLAHSMVSRRADGSCTVEYLPVNITRWPPGERVYGEAATHAQSHQVAGVAVSPRAGV
jgi:fumarate reductase flavoprotein subunit